MQNWERLWNTCSHQFSLNLYSISTKFQKWKVMPKSKNDQPIALDRAHLGSRLHRSRGQSSVLESWRSLGSPQLPGPSFPAYESPPTANRRVHWWGFTTLQDGSRRILPHVRLGGGNEAIHEEVISRNILMTDSNTNCKRNTSPPVMQK